MKKMRFYRNKCAKAVFLREGKDPNACEKGREDLIGIRVNIVSGWQGRGALEYCHPAVSNEAVKKEFPKKMKKSAEKIFQ